MSAVTTQSTHRTDLDGLRALAITLVVVFHAFPQFLPGGYVGVDVFLVLSGYLITGSLMRGGGNPLRFYARRARRLVPSLAVVLVGCLVLGWWVMLPGEYEQLGKHVAGAAAFLSNIVLYLEAGYFDAASESKPLLHLWYLGLDAQFSVIWPLAMLVLARWGRPLWLGIAVLLVLSFAFNLWQVAHDPSGAYFLPMARLWEFWLGGLVAAIRPGVGTRLLNALALAAVAAVLVAAFLLDRTHPYPGWAALIPTLATATLILAGPHGLFNRRILAHPLMLWLGGISYPLYLWHWPLLTFLRLETEGAPGPILTGLAVAFSVAAAWATGRWVERPLRDSVLAGATVAAAMAGLLVFNSGGVPARMPLVAEFDAAYANQNYSNAHDLFRHDRQECNFYDGRRNAGKTEIAQECFTPHSAKSVLVWGDSHSQHLQYGLKQALPADVSLLQVAASGCIPSLVPFDDDPVGACNRANAFAVDLVAKIKPDVVLLAQEGHHEENDYAAIIARLRQAGAKRVILVGPVPHWKPHLYKVVERKYRGTPPRRTWENSQPDALATDRFLKEKFGASAEVEFISLIDRLCDAEGCPVYLGDSALVGLTSYDYGHFTLPMSEMVGRTILAPAIMR